MYGKLDIKVALSTAFHPQTDGQTERVNQDALTFLRMFTDRRQDDWADLLHLAEFSYNNRVHSATKVSPFYAHQLYHPKFNIDTTGHMRHPEAKERLKEIKKVHEEAKAALELAAESMKRAYDKGKGKLPEFKIGDRVLLEGTNLKPKIPSKKLGPKRWGPFKITEKISDLVYRLDLPKAMNNIHNVFHVGLLTPYPDDTIPGRVQVPPPPVEIDGIMEEEVEAIVDSKFERGILKYLVKWKGFTDGDNSWEPAENVANSKELVAEYHEKHPTAPRPHPSAPQRIHAALFNKIPWRTLENFTNPDPSQFPTMIRRL